MASEKNNDKLSDDKLDELIDKIAKGSKKTKINYDKTINYDDVDFNELDSNTKKVYTDLFTGMPDLYKLVNASPDDSHEIIKKKCTDKLGKYHPDKIAPLLSKVPLEQREKEKKKIALQYKLIKEAYSTLRHPEKRKYYDLQRKTIDSKNFTKQKNSFEEFKKLQESEISEQSKKNSDNLFKMKMIELDERHGFNRKELDEKPISCKKASKKMGDLMMERDQQDIEYQPKDLFSGKSFNLTDFNKQFDKMRKFDDRRSKNKTGNTDSSMVKWEGISAINDIGIGGSTDYVSIDSNYENLYTRSNLESGLYANKLDSDASSDSEFNLSDVSDEGIDSSYVTNHNKDKGEIMKKFTEYNNSRTVEDEIYDKREFNDKTQWKSVMDNPFNISADMGNMVGNDLKQLEGPRRKKKIGKDLADAYKQLMYDGATINNIKS
jgi:hypothetical protein